MYFCVDHVNLGFLYKDQPRCSPKGLDYLSDFIVRNGQNQPSA